MTITRIRKVTPGIRDLSNQKDSNPKDKAHDLALTPGCVGRILAAAKQLHIPPGDRAQLQLDGRAQ